MPRHITVEELKQKVGKTWLMLNYTIGKELLGRFAAAVGDVSSRWQTEVPPALLATVGLGQVSEQLVAMSCAVLHGGTEMEYFSKVNVGDTITVVVGVESVREHASNTFVQLKIEQYIQRDVLVVRCKQLIALRSIA